MKPVRQTIYLAKDVLGPDAALVSEDEIDQLNMLLLVKDQYNVSGWAYHEMASICKRMPRHYKIKKRIQELNRLWNIKPTPNGTLGVQQSLQDRLSCRILRLLKLSSPNAEFWTNRNVRVKLSGDGTWIGIWLHVVNFTFTLLDGAIGAAKTC